jgi:hypothetical protein
MALGNFFEDGGFTRLSRETINPRCPFRMGAIKFSNRVESVRESVSSCKAFSNT